MSGRFGIVGATLAASAELVLLLKPFGDVPLVAVLFTGWTFAICSKWDRRDETGFWIVEY